MIYIRKVDLNHMQQHGIKGACLAASLLWMIHAPAAQAQLHLTTSSGTISYGTTAYGSYITGDFTTPIWSESRSDISDPGFTFDQAASGNFGGGIGSIYAIPEGSYTGIVRPRYGVRDTRTTPDAASVASLKGATVYEALTDVSVQGQMDMPFYFQLDAPAYEGDLPYVAAHLSVNIHGVNAYMDFYFDGSGGTTDRMEVYIGPHGPSSEVFSETTYITASPLPGGGYSGSFGIGYIFDTGMAQGNDLISNSGILDLTAYSGFIGTSDFSSVPEPAAYQVITGLGLTAVATWRRRRSVA